MVNVFNCFYLKKSSYSFCTKIFEPASIERVPQFLQAKISNTRSCKLLLLLLMLVILTQSGLSQQSVVIWIPRNSLLCTRS